MAQNPAELFDVVDEDDRVIGTSTRAEVHRLHLRHRAVHILLYDAEGRVYLQRRSWEKDSAPGCWDSSCSGHLDAGEAYLPAAVRELGEELGIRIDPSALEEILRLPASEDTGMEFIRIYRTRATADPVPDPVEILEGTWVTPDEVDRRILEEPRSFARAFRFLWEQLRQSR